jgi:hypothetical protein
MGKYVLLTHRDLDRAEAWFARRGEPVVLFGRFIPLLRSFVSFAAGLGEMAVAKFLTFTGIGCAIWCSILTIVGFELGSGYTHVLKAFRDALYVAIALAIVAIAGLFIHRIRVVRAERDLGAAHSAGGSTTGTSVSWEHNRHSRRVSPTTLRLLLPLFRYSYSIDAHVLRGLGRRFGPILKPRKTVSARRE